MGTQPNRWKAAFIILAVVSFCLFCYLAIKLISQSMTLSMLHDEYGRREAALSMLRKSIPDMLRTSNPSKQDILAILQKHNHGAPIFLKKSALEMDLMRFQFAADGSLHRIEQTDDYGFDPSDMDRPPIPER